MAPATKAKGRKRGRSRSGCLRSFPATPAVLLVVQGRRRRRPPLPLLLLGRFPPVFLDRPCENAIKTPMEEMRIIIIIIIMVVVVVYENERSEPRLPSPWVQKTPHRRTTPAKAARRRGRKGEEAEGVVGVVIVVVVVKEDTMAARRDFLYCL